MHSVHHGGCTYDGATARVHKLPRICNLQQDSHLCASQEICNNNVGLPHETPCGSSFGHPWTNSSVVNEWQIVLIICRICSLQQPMSRFIQYHQKLFNSTRICTCIAQSAEGLTHARQELQRLSAILVVMVLLHKPELNNYGVSSYWHSGLCTACEPKLEVQVPGETGPRHGRPRHRHGMPSCPLTCFQMFFRFLFQHMQVFQF